jgi:hypothetical protein
VGFNNNRAHSSFGRLSPKNKIFVSERVILERPKNSNKRIQISGQKIRIMIGLFLLLALFLFASLRNIQASGPTKVGEKNLLFQEKDSRTSQTVKISKPRQIIVLRIPEDQKLLPEPRERGENKLPPKEFQWGQSCLEEEKTFKDRGEAEKYLECLLAERKVLEGDFYGLNLTAYRYVNIFYRRGYIRHKIFNIDKEIKRTKSALHDIEN